MSRFRDFLLAANAAVVSSHSEDVSPIVSSLCYKLKSGKLFLKSLKYLSIISQRKNKSWLASILTNFAMTKYAFTLAEVISPPSTCRSKLAFTLAEVLITLGIIGVVAAMTIPSLIQKHNEKVLINKLKVIYSQLDNAANIAIAENGSIDQWGDKSEILDYYEKYILKNLNVVKTCEKSPNVSVYGACWGKTYDKRNGTSFGIGYMQKSFVLANGVSVSFKATNGDNYDSVWCKSQRTEMQSSSLRYLQNCGTIQVDLNGQKLPNKYGVDLFHFNIFKDGIDTMGKDVDIISGTSFENGCLNKIYGGGTISCSAWVIANENMDYLHCNDLSWSGKKSCK